MLEIYGIASRRKHMRSFIYNFLLAVLICSLVSFFAFARFHYPLTGIDDANIYFVYARNLVNGYGLVYNPGGERVEGFTSLLWMLMAALAFRVSAHAEVALLIINIVILSLGIAFALTYLQRELFGAEQDRRRSFFYSIAFLALLLGSPRYTVWNTITLIDSGLWSSLLLVATIFVIKAHPSARQVNAGLVPLIVLLILTRPEAMLWGAVFVGLFFIRSAFAKGVITALRDLAPSILCFAVSATLLTLFRLWYFGYPLPNTYYAKVAPSFSYSLQQGFGYLGKYATSDPIVLLSISVIVAASIDTISAIFAKRTPDDGSFLLPFIAMIGVLAPVLTGGDHFGAFRMYQNIYPIEILCLFYFASRVFPGFIEFLGRLGMSPWMRTAIRSSTVLVTMLVFVASQFQLWALIKPEVGIEFKIADYGRKNAALIEKLFSPLSRLPSLGVVTSGGIKYSYDGEIVDLMGLNNTLIAHNGGDRQGIRDHAAFEIRTFYQLQPDVVWPVTVIEKDWQYSKPAIKESWENTQGLKGLFDQPDFLQSYVYSRVSSNPDNGYALVAWFKRDFLKQVSADSHFQVEEYQYDP